MEIADLYVINKADRDGANHLSAAVTAMLHMADLSDGWNPPVLLTQAYASVGISELWDSVIAHRDYLSDTGGLDNRRAERRRSEFLETVQEELYRRIRERLDDDAELGELLRQIDGKTAEPYGAASGVAAGCGVRAIRQRSSRPLTDPRTQRRHKKRGNRAGCPVSRDTGLVVWASCGFRHQRRNHCRSWGGYCRCRCPAGSCCPCRGRG